ncbi:MAG: IscS subfamily cysteine desulfurase [Candidatus Sumerlaeia bacterium]|nr:IscS subfamily cysteine desulfurase [Candidatus Sumerlaeia bacterium]
MKIMAVKTPIYMDNHATTPTDPRVVEAMLPYFTEVFGNAASRNHSFGWQAEEAVENARATIAKAINADSKEIVFTSGATESNNLAIKGIAEMYAEKGNHIITCVTEHKAVIDPCKKLERQGFDVTWLPVLPSGLIDLDALRAAITDKTILITIMHGNNEIGVIQPVDEIGAIAAEKGIVFHTDATQTVGKIPVDVKKSNIHLLSFSGHKLYGPKGVGVLYVRRRKPRVRVTPILDGGGHERGMRSGTLNVTGIVGLGKAVELCIQEMESDTKRLSGLRDHLRKRLLESIPESYENGDPNHKLPHSLNISFSFVEGESLLMGIAEVAVSSGSACTSASLEPSYVLKSLGLGDELAHSSIRFGLGRFTTKEEVDYVADKLISVVEKLREMSPLYEMHNEGIDLSKVEWAHH